MLPFLRPELAEIHPYTPNPGGLVVQPLDQLDTNEFPLDLPPALKDKLAHLYVETMAANRYPDGGHGALRGAIAQYLDENIGQSGHFSPEQISVGNGSDELIRSLLIATCLGGRGAVLVATPTFGMYAILAQTLGVPVVSVGRSASSFEIDLEAAQGAIARGSVAEPIAQANGQTIRIIFVVHPNSPTANALSPAELNWLAQVPQDILVVIDEAYFEFSGHTVAEHLAQHPNWVIMRTFSKGFRLAAHRVGYAVGHANLIANLEKIRLPYNLPSFTQAAALWALRERQDLLAGVDGIISERQRLTEALQQHTALRVWPSEANFLYAQLRGGTDEDLAALITALKQRGTVIRHTGGGLRITIGTPAENERTLAHLAELLPTLNLN
jgi:histidinol-phosphate aminotransferase